MVSCILANIYVLFSGADTIFYLRVYHAVTSVLLVSAMTAMITFMIKASSLARREPGHQIHGQTLVALVVLTVAVSIGFAFFIVFTLAYRDCDKLMDIPEQTELEMEVDLIIYGVVSVFALTSLVYILQRCLHGKIDDRWKTDYVLRRWIDVVIVIMWVEVLVHKGYLSQKELCGVVQTRGHWCPIRLRKGYNCKPDVYLAGMQRVWYYIFDGLLKPTVQQCAAEYFPVLLVAHWVACGGGSHGKDDVEVSKESEGSSPSEFSVQETTMEDDSVNRATPSPIEKNIEATDGNNNMLLKRRSRMRRRLTTLAMNIMSFMSAAVLILWWFIRFYFAMRFNKMELPWPLHDYVYVAQAVAQVALFSAIYARTLRLRKTDFDATLAAHSRADMVILCGSTVFLALKALLLVAELQFQQADSIISHVECWRRTVARLLTFVAHLQQLFVLRKVVAIRESTLLQWRGFLPYVALSAVIANASYFASSFFYMQLLKFQLSQPELYKFADGALICNIFIQIMFSVNFLYAFTAAGLWMHVFLRYVSMGHFRLGKQPELLDVGENE